MADARKHPRHETLIPAEADIFGRSVPVNVIEISLEGLRLRSKEFMPPDTLVAVTIMVGRNITFSGWVIWVLDKFMPDGQVYHTGIKINSITDAANRTIGITEREALIQELVSLGQKK